MAGDNGRFVVEYTTKDIFEKIEKESEDRRKQDEKTNQVLQDILSEAKKTNGRVTKNHTRLEELSKRSIGVWIGKYPYKFALACILIIIGLMIVFGLVSEEVTNFVNFVR